MVVGAEVFRDPPRGRVFARRRLGEADGERPRPNAELAGHDGDDERRVVAARQERADRHIGHKPVAHRLNEKRAQLVRQAVRVGHRSVRGSAASKRKKRRRLLKAESARLKAEVQARPRFQFSDVAVDRPRRRNVLEQ